ncbi:MAG: hypothetical protein ACOYNY_30930 [Caldilineaceae bacterium]
MIKRIAGLLGVLLGAVGVVLCLAVIMGTWWVSGPVTTQLLSVFPPIETALALGDLTITQFEAFVDDTQMQFNATADAKPVATVLADEIVRAGMLVNVASGLVASVESALSQFSRTERLTTALDGVAERLNSAKTLAQQIEDGRTDRIDAMNTELNALRAKSTALQTAIDAAANDVATIKRRVPRWVDLGSLIITLLFVWFGVAQYNLLRNSWRLMRCRLNRPWFERESR